MAGIKHDLIVEHLNNIDGLTNIARYGASGGFFVGLVAYFGIPVGLNTVFGPLGIVAIPSGQDHERFSLKK